MYKYYKKDNFNIMEYDFDSITEFINYLDNNKTSKSFEGEYLASYNEKYEFTKTSSFEEAEKLCKSGYHEEYDKLIELKLKLEKYIRLSRKNEKQFNDYIGYAPDVKAYLEGNPMNMLNKKREHKKRVNIYYNSAVLGDITNSQILNRGVITLNIVEALEKLNYSVNLNIFTMSEEKNQIHYAKFNLKRENERLNIQKLYFPMCHPSFHRRLVFRLREETSDISKDWINGYGRTSNEKTIRKILDLNEDDIIICRPEEMNVYGDNIIEDADNAFNHINKQKAKKL